MFKYLKKNKIKFFLWLILALFFVFIIYRGLSPFGRAVYSKQNNKKNYFISGLQPADRLDKNSAVIPKITGDPVYFTLKTLRPWEKAKITFEYKNVDTPIIEAGILADKKIWQYQTLPVENKYLDDLSKKWFTIREGYLLFLQRIPGSISLTPVKYNSIAQFLKNLPDQSEIALYNYDLKNKFLLADYKPNTKRNLLPASIRGAYQLYTYIKDESLNYNFIFFDLNKNKDKDDISINLYYQDKLIDSRNISDDQDRGANEKYENRGKYDLSIVNLPEGVYKIEVKANDDVITKNISTNQSKISFINKIWLADSSQKNVELITDSSEINAQTINPGSLQTLDISGQALEVKETYKQFTVWPEQAKSKINFKKTDIIISGNGVFSFSDNQYFDPSYKKVGYNFKDSGVNYILAKYTSPLEKDGWKTASVSFDMTKGYNEKEKGVLPGINLLSKNYSFLISIPGLSAGEKDGSVEIKEIKIELSGKKIWEIFN